MAFMIAVVVLLARTEPFSNVLQKRHLHDLAKLLLAFVMLWAYFDFSQLLIIWSGNLRRNQLLSHAALWRLGRSGRARAGFSFLRSLFPASFAGRETQRAGAPENCPVADFHAPRGSFLDDAAGIHLARPAILAGHCPPLALGGLWLGLFAFNLRQYPLLPIGDPNLEETLEHHEH